MWYCVNQLLKSNGELLWWGRGGGRRCFGGCCFIHHFRQTTLGHWDKWEKEKASAKLSISKGLVEKDELGDEEEEEEDIEDSASTH